MTPSSVSMQMYANHELSLHLGASVRGDDVFIIQSGSDNINDHLMELLIMIHACKIASARRICAVIPYFFYGKWSKKKKSRGSITAKLVANMLVVAGVSHVITMDLHSAEIQGFFTIPVDNLLAQPSVAKYIRESIPDYSTGVVVSKNAGGVKRVTSLADRLKIDFALIHRDSQTAQQNQVIPGVAEPALQMINGSDSKLMMSSTSSLDSLALNDEDPMHQHPFLHSLMMFNPTPQSALNENEADAEAIEEDEDDVQGGDLTLLGSVQGKVAFVVDDVIDSTRTFLDAARHLITQCGAKKVYLVATHGILSGDALQEIEQCSAVHGVIVTNTYPISDQKKQQSRKLHVIDISGVLSEAIRRTRNGESISYLFDATVV